MTQQPSKKKDTGFEKSSAKKNLVIEIKDLCLKFGEHCIFDHLNLDIIEGETLGIVGGSGSGKSTLLRSILQLQPINSGSIQIFGNPYSQLSLKKQTTLKRNWGVLFQTGALFSGLTALENIAFPLREHTKLKPPAINELALSKLLTVGLSEDAATKYPAELSGGMEKRVALARAIALDPKLLFLDEPTAGLDPEAATALDNLILHLKATLGLTIIMITHDLDSLWTVTDRVAFLGKQQALEVLPIADLVKSTHPLIQHYFSGPRGRVTQKLYHEFVEKKF
jgi:phospholipid/cholesterol/gamma-HCH transport system ATP-binding protein